MKDAKRSGHDECEASGMLPVQRFPQIPDGKNRKDGKRDDFLYGLEFRGGERSMAEAIGGLCSAIIPSSSLWTLTHAARIIVR
jgi:hypothetical protein